MDAMNKPWPIPMIDVSPRDAEAEMLQRTLNAVQGEALASDARDALVFKCAASILRPNFPEAAKALDRASKAYFSAHPGEELPVQEVVRRGWLISLPRFRDRLECLLRQALPSAQTKHV